MGTPDRIVREVLGQRVLEGVFITDRRLLVGELAELQITIFDRVPPRVSGRLLLRKVAIIFPSYISAPMRMLCILKNMVHVTPHGFARARGFEEASWDAADLACAMKLGEGLRVSSMSARGPYRTGRSVA
jgi:hypothetical protein